MIGIIITLLFDVVHKNSSLHFIEMYSYLTLLSNSPPHMYLVPLLVITPIGISPRPSASDSHRDIHTHILPWHILG